MGHEEFVNLFMTSLEAKVNAKRGFRWFFMEIIIICDDIVVNDELQVVGNTSI